jgi:hypothetical protein
MSIFCALLLHLGQTIVITGREKVGPQNLQLFATTNTYLQAFSFMIVNYIEFEGFQARVWASDYYRG